MRQRSDRQETTTTRWQELELPRRTSNREREIQLVEPVIFERSDFEEQQGNSGKQDEEEDGILEYDSPSDDDDMHLWSKWLILLLGRGSRFGRSVCFKSRIVFS